MQPGLRYGAQRPATWPRSVATHTAGARNGARQGSVLRYKVCIVTGGDGREAATRLCVAIQCATRPARPATLPASNHDTVGHRPTTRPGRSARGLCAQAGPRCSPGAPNPVLTQDTVLSHCLGHCS